MYSIAGLLLIKKGMWFSLQKWLICFSVSFAFRHFHFDERVLKSISISTSGIDFCVLSITFSSSLSLVYRYSHSTTSAFPSHCLMISIYSLTGMIGRNGLIANIVGMFSFFNFLMKAILS